MDGATLRRLRLRAGLTQRGLAERLGLTANHLARLERGEVRITDPVARLIMLTLATRAPRARNGRR